MSITIQPCSATDLSDMLSLLVADARQRHRKNPVLWAFDEKTHGRIETILRKGFEEDNPSIREYWLLARDGERPVGITHAIIVPVPPIYKIETSPGLLLDECYVAEDAPADTIKKMLDATEAALRDAGAGNFIASCCAGSPWRSVLEESGYKPVTLFMSKVGFERKEMSHQVGLATADDIAGIVSRSAEHRHNLSEANPVFWNIHPDADSIFEKWMRISLTLEDRAMLVTRNSVDVDGYIIAQPVTPVQMPMTHNPEGIGAIDDFYHTDFRKRSELVNGGAEAADLLIAAENAFARNGIKAALVVCPDNWSSKKALLTSNGYTTAKTWLLNA